MDQIAHILNNHVGGIMDNFAVTQTDRPTQDFFSGMLAEDTTLHIDIATEPHTIKPELNIQKIKSTVFEIQNHLHNLLNMLEGVETAPKPKIETDESITYINGEQIIEGVFNGEKMIGADGQEYSVPQNYASKSKLVEGDIMKLTIRRDGKFMYKQIGPIDRKRIIGILAFEEDTQLWVVRHQEKNYKILTASATFYRGKPGDEVIILVPQDCEASWGAVENIMR
ncbi:MAG: hypothetical protein HYV41_00375 [Candidatus Magasanikbacteria bacterium]|nr:hypothetical protein [Candidatus Magasanikbacteria bacterium]